MAQVENAVRCSALLDLPWNASRRHAAALELCEALLEARRLASAVANKVILRALGGMFDVAQKTCPRELDEVKGRFL